MKTAKEILNIQFDHDNTDNNISEDGRIYGSIISAMQEYAEQEIHKHLKIAADEAVVNLPFMPHINGTKNVYKHSITGIKIELT